ncbi:ATP-dependent DNA helicase RecQ [Actinopolymorpha rutila]|uniref:DNA 3'-5' helicase n=1 Tax=Actinopolymorpha rutila TaxID=446787 RepID=A0A852Z8J9_9ACTN|nr:ATP-dependent DNA helicase RecQ [Actinopolymorpha rutila]
MTAHQPNDPPAARSAGDPPPDWALREPPPDDWDPGDPPPPDDWDRAEVRPSKARPPSRPDQAERVVSPPADLRAEADAHLRRLVGRDDAAFREGQWEAIEALVARRRRALVVQRTGWGKSAVYFVATALRRAQGAGPTLIVSPLLALMRDQVAAAERAGIRAVTINSANADEWADVVKALGEDEVDVLLVSPERLNNPRFRAEQLPELAERTGLLVVDEAHCVSDWGHDFRPDYRRIRDLLARLPADTPVLGTTATANARVVADVAEQLGGGEVLTLRGPLARDSLRLGVLRLPTAQQRLAWLLAHLDELPGSGIIYTLTVAAADDIAALLREAGHAVLAYTGRTDDAERRSAEEALRGNDVKALVATSALGMGFDKPDLGFIVHVGAPSSPIAYYQQIGRAGRATERADVLLLPGVEDADIWRYFATASMPRQDQADAVIAALGDAGKPMSTAALEVVVDVRRTRLELLLKVLDVEGAVRRVSGGWEATGRPWVYDAERYSRVAGVRDAEATAMLEFEKHDGCRMAYLQRALDDPSAAACGRCDRCAGEWYPTDVPAPAQEAAAGRLAQVGVPIEPRAMWPSGMDRLGVPVRGRIAAAERAETGRAVARLTDLGWGQRLRTLLAPGAEDAQAPEGVLSACVDVLRTWGWERRPVAVVALSSRARPRLVGSVAEGLARIGRLPLLGTMEVVHGGPIGEPGGNSAFRLAGVWERLDAGTEVREGLAVLARDTGEPPPVLLVDDLVDSRWTMTVAARALRQAGAGKVLPFALAVAG